MIPAPRLVPRLVLASASTARAAVLRGAGLAFDVQPTNLDEAAVKANGQAAGDPAATVALRLAAAKAAAVTAPGAVVIGADQLLVCDGQWFDKPADLATARTQLLALRGRTHLLETALCCMQDGRELWRHMARPRLTMRAFSDAFLDDYLAREGDRLLACVGAYRLEGLGVQLFDHIEGEHAAVLGLPLLPLLAFLRGIGVLPG